MSIFIIAASVFFAVNLVFLILSLIYTIYFRNKVPPRPSLAPSVVSGPHAPRHSNLPQVMLYHTFVRLSHAKVEPQLPKQTTWQKVFGRKRPAKEMSVVLAQ